MSASAVWELVPEKPKQHSIGYLTQILKSEYNLTDGSTELTVQDIPFLKGVKLAGDVETMKNANDLINAINKHGKVKIYLQY